MRGTLSHSDHGLSVVPVSGYARSGRFALAAILLAGVLAAATGCNNIIDADSVDIDAERGGTARDSEDAAAKSDFVWPVDPSHPVLTLEIESPATQGTIHVELMPELAPITVTEIIDSANQGYYDGTTFHRVIRGFMIQGGDPNSRDRDPTNDGKGRPDIVLLDEFGDAPFLRGVVGIGNKGHKDSNGTQLFIMQEDDRRLDGRYTAIGRVVDGMEVVDAIANVATDKVGRWGPKDRPIENVVMTRVSLTGQISALATSEEMSVAGEVVASGAGEVETAAASAGPER